MQQTNRSRRRAGTVTALVAALAIGGGATALMTTDALQAQTALNPPSAATPYGGLPTSFADVVEKVGPAVVNIQVSKRGGAAGVTGNFDMDQLPEGMRDFFKHFFGDEFAERFGRPDRDERGPQRRGPRGRTMVGVGSGFIISPDGYVVTNNHVVDDADEVTVTLQDRDEFEAKVIGTDAKTDLALLKIKGDKQFPYVVWGNSEKARVGDWVIAVGNPFGLGHSVTTGIISARGRTIGAGPYDDFLQISAPINRGNSGGPTFNIGGEVIGVNTAIFSPSGGSVGIGFAIPSNMAQQVIAQLKENGKVERGWLGVMIQNVTDDIAASVGLDKAQGAIVAQVTPGGPAEKAGIRQGDVILSVNGETVDQMRELPRLVANLKAGKDAELVVMRDGKRRTIEVAIGRMPESDKMAMAGRSGGDAAQSEDALGLKLARLDDKARQRYGIDEKIQGVVVADVDDDSEAAEKGISSGDVIVSIEQKPVSSPAEVVDRIRKAKQEERRAVLLLLNKNGQERFVALPLRKA